MRMVSQHFCSIVTTLALIAGLGAAPSARGQTSPAPATAAAPSPAAGIEADCAQRADPAKAIAACTGLVAQLAKARPRSAARSQSDKSQPDPLAVAYANLAAAQQAKGDHRAALTNYGWALVYDRTDANLWHARALVRADLAQPIRAAADETVAIHYDPRRVDAWIARGDLYRAMGALGNAISDATEALKLDPKSAVAFANRAYAYLRSGQPDKAIADAGKAIELDARSVRGYLSRGLALEKTDKTAATADLKKVLELDAGNAMARDALSRIGS